MPTGETAHFKCNVKQSARLSQRILCSEARECPCNSLQPFRTLKDYFTEGSSDVCVRGIGSKQNTCVSKANSASSHIWLKTELRIVGERIVMHPWIDFFLPPLFEMCCFPKCITCISHVYSPSVNVRKPWKYFHFVVRSAWIFALRFSAKLHRVI